MDPLADCEAAGQVYKDIDAAQRSFNGGYGLRAAFSIGQVTRYGKMLSFDLFQIQ